MTEDARHGSTMPRSLLSAAALGVELDVTLVESLPRQRWGVTSPELAAEGATGVLLGVAEGKAAVGSIVRGWIGLTDADRREVILLARDFGRLPISDGQRAKYRLALTAVADLVAGGSQDAARADQVSEFKGMLNRCIRHDQRDWLAVYDLFGRPPELTLHRAVAAAIELRQSLLEDDKIESGKQEMLAALANRALQALDDDRPRLDRSRISGRRSRGVVDGPSRTQFEVDAEKTRTARALHGAALDALRGHLEAMGYIVEENVHVDAYARLQTGPAIFEVKSLGDSNEAAQIRSGLSQLYEYRYRYDPYASLWLVLSRPLSADGAWMLDYLQEDRKIGVLWLALEGGLDGPWIARLGETLHAARRRQQLRP